MTNMRIEDDDEFEDEGDEDIEWEDEEVADDLAYKILSGSESKVERELNILSQEGWTIDEMSAFDSNNGTVNEYFSIEADGGTLAATTELFRVQEDVRDEV